MIGCTMGLGFDFEEEKIRQEILRLSAKRVLLQMPQGLKPYATQVAEAVSATGALPIISLDPCYGACDLAVCEAESLGADLVVHFGHSKMVPQTRVPTLYVETRATVDIDVAVQHAIALLGGYQKIGLVTSVQHLQTLNRAEELLAAAGKVVQVGDAGQLAYGGQVTGCNYSNAQAIATEVEAFLFVGGGIFHALGVALSSNKPTIIADPYDNRAYNIADEAQRILKQRFASIQQAKTAQTIGILVGLKLGQKHLDKAAEAKMAAERHGLAAFLLAGKEITPDALLEFPVFDAYVNTACPRISLDAPGKFQKPMLTVREFMVVLGEESWENLVNAGLFEN